MCYLQAGVQVPDGLKAHTTQVIAASAGCLHHIPISEICRVATWSLINTFTYHCSPDAKARSDIQFGRVALQSLFN